MNINNKIKKLFDESNLSYSEIGEKFRISGMDVSRILLNFDILLEEKQKRAQRVCKRIMERRLKNNKKSKKLFGKGLLKLRFQILQRDNFTCQYCGRKAPEAVLHIDHIYPQCKGINDTEKNLITACQECNLGKGDILLKKWRKKEII